MYIENPLSLANTSGLKVAENPFLKHDEETDVAIVVENTELYVNGDILKIFSPVFRAMLSENFIEGKKKLIKLPEKKLQDIIVMLRFFYPTKEILFTEAFDFYPLLTLCEEYQLDWLKKKITHFICFSFNEICFKVKNMDGKMVVYFLYMSEQFNIGEIKDKCYNLQFQTTFENMIKIKNLALLSKEAKLFIHLFYMKQSVSKLQLQIPQYTCCTKTKKALPISQPHPICTCNTDLLINCKSF